MKPRRPLQGFHPRACARAASFSALFFVACAAPEALEPSVSEHDAQEPPEGDEQALYQGTPNLWPGGVVPVCFPGHQPDDPHAEYVRWVLNDSWAASADLRFVGFDDCSNHVGRSHVEVTYVSGRPHAMLGARGTNATIVRLPFREQVRTVDGSDRSYLRNTVLHEFGHALGFAHEQQRTDFVPSAACRPDPNDASNWSTMPGVPLSAYDARSVMSYCSNNADNLTEGDRSGVARVYGPPGPRPPSATRGLVWHAADGRVLVWLMRSGAGTLATSAWPAQASRMQGASIVATGDMNGDGLGDVVWRAASRETRVWLMNSGSVEGTLDLFDPGPAWRLSGAGDFDADGRSDIVWVSQEGGLAIASANGQNFTPGNVLQGKQLVAVADFDGDQRADLLLRASNGDVTVWPVSTARPAYLVSRGLSGAWTIVKADDFDGDRRADVLLHSNQGELAVWPAADVSRAVTLRTLAPDVFVAATGDFDADGGSDILLRNAAGQGQIWLRGQWQRVVNVPTLGGEWMAGGALLDRVF